MKTALKSAIQINRGTMLPFLLTGVMVLVDQAVKTLIVLNWPEEGTLIKDLFGNDVVLFCHVRNKAIAFSLGQNIPEFLRFPFFILFPLVVLGFLLGYYFTSSEFRPVQRWAVAGIIGGGIGNIIDRIFRPGGVVDFISVKFYGLLGMERWPTFNIADAGVVVCCFLLLVTILPSKGLEEKAEKELSS
ncbi:MAG: signal peptidase II [Treponema sp.]|nr:signal peptidase II [Treponema sp.]